MRQWRELHGDSPRRMTGHESIRIRVGERRLERLMEGDWPAVSVVTRLFGRWAFARRAVLRDDAGALMPQT